MGATCLGFDVAIRYRANTWRSASFGSDSAAFLN